METQIVDVHMEDLPIVLSDAELRARGRELALAQQELESFRDTKKKSAMAALKAEETAIAARVSKLAAALTSGVETKPVTVEGIVDLEAGVVTYRRKDTGEKVRERGILPTERQTEIPGTGGDVLPMRFEPTVVEGGAGEEPTAEEAAAAADLSGDTSDPIPEGSLEQDPEE